MEGIHQDTSVSALRKSMDIPHCSEFQGEREYFLGHLKDFAVLEIIEKSLILALVQAMIGWECYLLFSI